LSRQSAEEGRDDTSAQNERRFEKEKMKFNRLIPSSVLLVLVLVLVPGPVSAVNYGYTYHSPVSGIPAQPGPFGIAFDSDNLCMYVADSSGYVSVIGGSSTNICGPHYQKITDIPLLGCQSGSYTPSAIAYDSHNHELYVGCYNFNANPSSLVEVICGSQTICAPMNGIICSGIPLPNGDIVSAIAFDPNTNNVYIATNSASVDVLSDSGCGPAIWMPCSVVLLTNCVISLASTCCGGQTLGAAYDQHNHLLYVATCCSTSGSQSYAINDVTNTVVATICLRGPFPPCVYTGSSYPAAVAIDTDAHEVYITDENANTVYYFPDTNPPNPLLVGGATGQLHGLIGAAYDSANHRVYVTNFNPSPYTVSVIFNHAVVGTVMGVICGPVTVGPSPYYLASDPDDHSIYVANHGGTGTVTIFEPINPTPPTTCTF